MGKQYVHLGRAMSGTPGLFTGHYLAMPLSEEEYERAVNNREEAERLAQRLGFLLEPLEES